MQPVSSRWMAGYQASTLTINARAELWTPPTASNPPGSLIATGNVLKGSVTIDATNAIRRSAQNIEMLVAPNPSGLGELGTDPFQNPNLSVPGFSSGALFPNGTEMVLYKGINYPAAMGGGTEEVCLGRFLMEDVEVHHEDQAGIYVDVSGRDRGGTISRDKFVAPYSTDGKSTLPFVLFALLSTRFPGATYNITPSNLVPAKATFTIGSDPWAAALQVAASIGYELFPDAQGVFVARPALNPIQTPVSATYSTGPGGIMTKNIRSLVNTNAPNVIVVESQGSGVTTPLVSYWWDSNVGSATYYNSTPPVPGSNMHSLPTRDPSATYPPTVSNTSTQLATTQLACDNIALGKGYGVIGLIDSCDVKIRDNPAHEPDDVVIFQDDDLWPTGTSYVLDTVIIQLDHSQEMEMKGRLVVL